MSVSGCFVNDVNVTGALAPTSLGLSPNILLQNTTTINITELDTTDFVDDVSSLSIDITADCSGIEEMDFSPAVGEVNLDGRVLTAVSGLCVEATHAQALKPLYAEALLEQVMNYDDIFKSCTDTVACENLRIAIFILTDDDTGESYGMQLEFLSETESSAPYLTLLTIVSENKIEYYGEVTTSTNISAYSQITSAISTLLSLDIDGLNTSEKNKKKLTKDLKDKGAIKDLEKALKPKYWSEENTLTEKDGEKAFEEVAKAVKDISKAKGRIDDESSDPSILALLDSLNEIEANLIESMRGLAVNR